MNPKAAETIYHLGTIVTAVIGIALIWGGIDAGTAEHLGDILAGLTLTLAGGAPATAAVRVHKQQKDGTLSDPAERIVKDLEALRETRDKADDALSRVQGVVTSVDVDVPVDLGPEALKAISNVVNPTQAFSLVNDTNAHLAPFDR